MELKVRKCEICGDELKPHEQIWYGYTADDEFGQPVAYYWQLWECPDLNHHCLLWYVHEGSNHHTADDALPSEWSYLEGDTVIASFEFGENERG